MSQTAKSVATRTGRTRKAILSLLKRGGPSDSTALALKLAVSAMAVRQHLYALKDEGMVTFSEESRAVGRPAKVWRVTSQADRHFSDSHAELAVGLIDAMEEAFGEQGVERMLAARARQQTEAYGKRISTRLSLPERVDALATIRSEEGYLANVERLEDGSLLLVENHCPVAAAAHRCRGLCGAELGVFREVLGPKVTVERTEHIVSGQRRCAYRVSEGRKRSG